MVTKSPVKRYKESKHKMLLYIAGVLTLSLIVQLIAVLLNWS